MQFVNTTSGWHFANSEKRAGNSGFFAAFGDNRFQIPPTTPANKPEMDRYPFYSPPGTGMASCINPGSRNTDVISAHLAADLVVGAPVAFQGVDPDSAVVSDLRVEPQRRTSGTSASPSAAARISAPSIRCRMSTSSMPTSCRSPGSSGPSSSIPTAPIRRRR